MSRLRRAGAPISQINVVPYLDVMLVLLVIFMVTAPLFNRGVVELPSIGEATASPQPTGALQIEYAANKRFAFIDYEAGIEESDLSVKDVVARLAGALRLRGEDTPVIVSADKNLLYGDVTELLGELKAAGFTKVGLEVESVQR